MKKKILLGISLAFSQLIVGQCNSETIFSETSENAVCEEIVDGVRYIYSNNIPDHGVGTLNGGFTVEAQEDTWTMCAEPTQAASFTQLYGDDSQKGCSNQMSFRFGVGANGIHYAPSSREYFENTSTGEYNYEWNIEAVEALGMNNQGAHLNSKGEYHYHDIAGVYFKNSLGIDGSSFSDLVAYAADGFPVYYKYAYTTANDNTSSISSFDSGWKLKSGTRSGDGVSAPDGTYDGYYIEDYEFDSSLTELDECNGRYGVTPEYPNGTYYYVLTDSWPYIPRCFAGSHVDESFLIGASCPSSTANSSCVLETLSHSRVDLEGKLQIELKNELLTVFGLENKTELIINIYDTNGALHLFSNTRMLNVSTLIKGVYFIEIVLDGQRMVKTILIR